MYRTMVSSVAFFLCFSWLSNGYAADAHAGKKGEEHHSCGQMMADKAVFSVKMAELMMAFTEMMEAHVNFMKNDTSAEAKKEVEGFEKLAKMHKDIAAQYTKTADAMKSAKDWANAPHDMEKMHADAAIQKSKEKMLSTHKEMAELLQKEVAQMESRKAHKGHK